MAQITLARYLFERIHQLNVDTIFGVPGDFNLTLLDKIYEVENLRWAGNANELNAAYAADGYSRIKGFACLVTTFGVGELSALNGVAGSYAEHVGVLHVVGVPSISAQSKQLMLHHTLGNGDFTVFHKMSSNISQTTGFIQDMSHAVDEIDRCIKEAYIAQRPVYLAVPANLVDAQVSSENLKTPLDLTLEPNDPEAQKEVIDTIFKLISNSKNPIILVDACASRHNVKKEVQQLIDLTQYPVYATPMGKGAVDEQQPRYGGVYVGTLSAPDIKKSVESADLILSVGAMLSDFNTGSFSYSYNTRNVVEFHSNYIKIGSATFNQVRMKYVLKEIIEGVSAYCEYYKPVPVPQPEKLSAPPHKNPETKISQQWLWKRISTWLQEGDIVITETGTSAFGIIQTHFPTNVLGISQVLWGSIGYAVGSCLGAVMAAQEIDPKKRVILFVGDGSLQLTVQEISTMCRNNNTPYLFVLNNDGYTIERLIHGENAQYNDIQSWDHSLMLPFFGAKNFENYKLSTTGEVDDLFENKDFNKNDKIRMIELMLAKMDAPKNLVQQAELSAKTNASN